MEARVITKDRFSALRGLSRAETWALESEKVHERPNRMEAIFYASEGYQALDAMRHSGFDVTNLGLLASVVWPGIFARRFVKDPEHGIPFLTSSTMMESRPRATTYLSKLNTRNLDAYLVFDGNILISRSGTVGNVALVTNDISGWAVTEDALRVLIKDPIDLGPVYCYLQSPLGQFLLKRSQTGSVVRHIYEADVSTMPIPHLPRRLRVELTARILKVSTLRVEANRLMEEAEIMVNTLIEKHTDELTDLYTYLTPSLPHEVSSGGGRKYPGGYSSRQPTRSSGR